MNLQPEKFKEPVPVGNWTSSSLHWCGLVAAGVAGGFVASSIQRIRIANELLINSDVMGAAIGVIMTIFATIYIDRHRQKNRRRDEAAPVLYALQQMQLVLAESAAGYTGDGTLPAKARWVSSHLSSIAITFETLPFARRNFRDRNLDLYRTLEAIQQMYDERKDKLRAEAQVAREHDESDDVVRIAYDNLTEFAEMMQPVVNSALEEFDIK